MLCTSPLKQLCSKTKAAFTV